MMDELPRNLRMTLAYDGTHYVGWQTQANGLAIQEVIEKAIWRLTKEKVNLLSTGRTDSGVHALGQVASFRTQTKIPPEGLRKGIQNYLPDDILIRDMAETDPKFHATYSAKYKRYRYVINNGRTNSPFFRQYSWHFYADLDSQAMQEAAQVIVGTQDFRSFESHWPNKATSVRTVMSLTVQRQRFCPLWFNAEDMPPSTDNVGDYIWIEIVADGFLYNMVRTIVGTLVAVGRGRWDGRDVRRIIDAQDRSVAGDCAPPQGLYLVDVCYE